LFFRGKSSGPKKLVPFVGTPYRFSDNLTRVTEQGEGMEERCQERLFGRMTGQGGRDKKGKVRGAVGGRQKKQRISEMLTFVALCLPIGYQNRKESVFRILEVCFLFFG
jgi:hypothetical protein